VTQAFRTFKPLGSCQSLSHIYLLSGCADAIAMGCLAAMVTAYRLRLPSRSGLTLQVLGVGTIAWRYWYWPVTTDHIMGPSIIAFGAAIFLFGACLPARGHYTGWTSAAFFPPADYRQTKLRNLSAAHALNRRTANVGLSCYIPQSWLGRRQ
jgi:hypothetical protein